MYSFKLLFMCLLSLFAIMLITEICQVEGKSRGGSRGGRGGSRGSGSRSISRGSRISRSVPNSDTRSTGSGGSGSRSQGSRISRSVSRSDTRSTSYRGSRSRSQGSSISRSVTNSYTRSTGSGGSGSRSQGSSISPVSRSDTKSTSYRGSRSRSRVNKKIRSGSSPFTRSTFTQALHLGYIYGSDRYMGSSRYRSNPDEMPTICTNYVDSDSRGTIYGYFICPRAGEPEHYTYCCGDDEKREHCCGTYEYNDNSGRLVGIIIGVLGGGIIIFVIIFCCLKQSEKEKKVDHQFNNTQKDFSTISTVSKPSSASDYLSKKTTPKITDDDTTSPVYDNEPEPSSSVQPTPVDTTQIGFENSDSAHKTPSQYSSDTTSPVYENLTLPPYTS